MSHHFDSPTAIADGRINLCDLFVFPGVPGTTTGSMLGNASVPRPPAAEFPHLSAPSPAELPALADLFGLREHSPR